MGSGTGHVTDYIGQSASEEWLHVLWQMLQMARMVIAGRNERSGSLYVVGLYFGRQLRERLTAREIFKRMECNDGTRPP